MANSHKHAREHGRTRQGPRVHAHAHAQRRRRIAHLVLPAAGLLTIVGASTAVVVADNASSPVVAQASAGDRGDLITSALQSNQQQLSRNAERAPLPNEAEAEKLVSGHMYVIESDAADVFADADDTSPVLAILAPGEKVAVTEKKKRGWTQIMHKDAPRWVKSSALTKEQEVSDKPCPKASESGLQPDTIRVIRAVCAKFPAVRSYGGMRGGGGDHGTGRAVDIMVDSATGDKVAAFLQKNRAELGIEYLIWKQRIWRPSTSGSWRGMSDRGSPTANHMDHVHASTSGNSGTS